MKNNNKIDHSATSVHARLASVYKSENYRSEMDSVGRKRRHFGATAAVAITSTMLLSSVNVHAATTFDSQDWQVACDNTRTCRLVGYQSDNSIEFPVSVMLTREAGSNAQINGKVKFGGAKEGSAKSLMQLGNRHRISLLIDGKDIGEAKSFSTTTNDAELTKIQVAALLEALAKTSKIEFVVRNTRWELSGSGATAVMAKADEAQGRTGTASAFVSKGSKPNSQVLTAQAAPQLRMVLPISKSAPRNNPFKMKSSKLAEMVQGSVANLANDCPDLKDSSSWRVSRLNSDQLLAQHKCWSGAYNTGQGMWLINDSSPYKPVLVTTKATSYNNGKISSVQKGRNIGDCLTKTEWVWTGSSFKKSYESTTGLCRMIATGGAWDLPTYVTDVKV